MRNSVLNKIQIPEISVWTFRQHLKANASWEGRCAATAGSSEKGWYTLKGHSVI